MSKLRVELPIAGEGFGASVRNEGIILPAELQQIAGEYHGQQDLLEL